MDHSFGNENSLDDELEQALNECNYDEEDIDVDAVVEAPKSKLQRRTARREGDLPPRVRTSRQRKPMPVPDPPKQKTLMDGQWKAASVLSSALDIEAVMNQMDAEGLKNGDDSQDLKLNVVHKDIFADNEQDDDDSDMGPEDLGEIGRQLGLEIDMAPQPQLAVEPTTTAEEWGRDAAAMHERIATEPQQRRAPVTLNTPATQYMNETQVKLPTESEPPLEVVEAPRCEAVTDVANSTGEDISECPLQTHGAFYWFDMKEAPEVGAVWLIGKILRPGATAYESCCVRVGGVMRFVMFRALPGTVESDVVGEIIQLCSNQGITSRRIKPVQRFYVFDGTEDKREKREAQRWFKLTYSAQLPRLQIERLNSTDGKGVSEEGCPLPGFTFIDHCVGERRSLVETFLLKRHFCSGPCFVRFDDPPQAVPTGERVSHCVHEFVIDRPKAVHVWDRPIRCIEEGQPPRIFYPPQTPRLTATAIQLMTFASEENKRTEVCAIALASAEHSISPDGGRRRTPSLSHVVAVRPLGAPLSPGLVADARSKGALVVVPFDSERELLVWLFEYLRKKDPDILLGHAFTAFTLDVLLQRAQEFKISSWDHIGRLRITHVPQLQRGAGGMGEATFEEKAATFGRLVFDTYLLAREHHKSTNYKLLALANEMHLHGTMGSEISEKNEPALTLIKSGVNPEPTLYLRALFLQQHLAALTFELASRLDIVPLTKQLCAQSGTTWGRTLFGGRSERVVSLLLHSFYKAKYVVPDRLPYGDANGGSGARSKRSRRVEGTEDAFTNFAEDFDGEEDTSAAAAAGKVGRRVPRYKGGMVLEPVSGLYREYVLLLDFNSLYPSLIQEFGICFSTVNRSLSPDFETSPPTSEDMTCSECLIAGCPCVHKCILPRTIERLVQQRREVKKQMRFERNEEVLAQLEIRQKALKLTANSMYGSLGFEHSRFYAHQLAELITRKGRDTLVSTAALIPTVAPSLHVIYGDTDSVMLSTGVKNDLGAVRGLGQAVKAAVNKRYRKLEIDIDGIFRSILLMKKKKYAALSVVNWEDAGDHIEQVVKGLDMVRRDWCPLSRDACQDVIDRVLGVVAPAGGEDEDSVETLRFIVVVMREVSRKVRAGEVPLEKFVISKSLTKEPEAYKGDGFPHATVALRMKSRGEAIRVGDLIPYIICRAEGSDAADGHGATNHKGIAARAFHVDEVRADPAAHPIDQKWYLETQVLPPVFRICEHIEGCTAAMLAEALGLEFQAQRVQQKGGLSGEQIEDFDLDCKYLRAQPDQSLLSCYDLAQPLNVRCPVCSTLVALDPHEYIRVEKLPVFEKQLQKEQAGEDVGEGLAPFCPYNCSACRADISPVYVANVVELTLRSLFKRFYGQRTSDADGAIDLRALQQQLSYFRALLDVPQIPGVRLSLVKLHRCYALSCIDSAGRYTTLDEAETKDGFSDLALGVVKRYYNRLFGMTVNLSTLFK